MRFNFNNWSEENNPTFKKGSEMSLEESDAKKKCRFGPRFFFPELFYSEIFRRR